MKRKVTSIIVLLCGSVLLLSILLGWINKRHEDRHLEIEKAVSKTVILLQQSGIKFLSVAACASCHNNSMTSMTVEKAKQKGISFIDSLYRQNKGALENMIRIAGNTNYINDFVAAKFLIPYVLIGMHADQCKPSFYTDIAVDYILNNANADGSFRAEAMRVPMEYGDVHLTALNIRAVDLFAPDSKRTRVDELMARTGIWLESVVTDKQQELAFQLMGLQWCGRSSAIKQNIVDKIRKMQHDDGGWSQLPSMKSDAYATGECLYALYESGIVKPTDAVYENGVNYLLKTQDATGAWIVESRSSPIQPYSNAEFPPYDKNQFISSAASNWAALALLNALPDK